MRASRGVDVDGGSLQVPSSLHRFSHDHRDTRDSYLSPGYYYRATSTPVSSTFCRKVWTAYLSWKLLEENVALQLKPCILFFVLYFSLLG